MFSNALQTHLDCKFCLGVRATKGLTFIRVLKDKFEQARDKVLIPFAFRVRFTSRRYAVIAALSWFDLQNKGSDSSAHESEWHPFIVDRAGLCCLDSTHRVIMEPIMTQY